MTILIVILYILLLTATLITDRYINKYRSNSSNIYTGYTCYKCKKDKYKSLEEFYLDDSKKDYKISLCKSCSRKNKIESINSNFITKLKINLERMAVDTNSGKKMAYLILGVVYIGIVIAFIANINVIIILVTILNIFNFYILYYRKYIATIKKDPE